jgi:hypothetical protein
MLSVCFHFFSYVGEVETDRLVSTDSYKASADHAVKIFFSFAPEHKHDYTRSPESIHHFPTLTLMYFRQSWR